MNYKDMMNRIAELDALNKKMKKDILRLKKRNARLDKVIKAKSLRELKEISES